MPAETAPGKTSRMGLQPFVLRWAEQSPGELLWSERSVFSAPVNGLDISMSSEPEHPETTGPRDMADTTLTE
jgi:hypothetical protein